MNKKVIILNGAARKNGNTAKLVEAFEDGAKSAGNQVKTFYLDGMEIHSCKGCLRADRDSKSPCSQKDDMDRIYVEFEDADVLLMTADGSDYSQAVTWYRTYERNLRWKNLGEVLGKGKTKEAYQLGTSI